jgi:hypothetical protein
VPMVVRVNDFISAFVCDYFIVRIGFRKFRLLVNEWA